MGAWHGQWRWFAAAALCAALGACKDGSPTDAGSLIQQAWEQYRGGEFRAAVAAFERASRSTSDPTLRSQALYGLATTWSMRRPGEDLPRADSLFEQIIQEYPTGELAAWSTLALARIKHLAAADLIDRDGITRAYQRVVQQYPSHPAADEAFLYQQSIAVASLDQADARGALKSLRVFVGDHPRSPLIPTAWGLIAECCRTLDDAPGQLQARLKALETREIDPLNPLSDQSGTYWHIATCAEFDVGDFETARRFYRLFMKEYPTDQRVYGAELALKRMDGIERRMQGGGP